MASRRLCRKGVREQFVAKSDGAEYVHCSNLACGYFCLSHTGVVREGGAVGRGSCLLQWGCATLSTPENLRLKGVPFG